MDFCRRCARRCGIAPHHSIPRARRCVGYFVCTSCMGWGVFGIWSILSLTGVELAREIRWGNAFLRIARTRAISTPEEKYSPRASCPNVALFYDCAQDIVSGEEMNTYAIVLQGGILRHRDHKAHFALSCFEMPFYAIRSEYGILPRPARKVHFKRSCPKAVLYALRFQNWHFARRGSEMEFYAIAFQKSQYAHMSQNGILRDQLGNGISRAHWPKMAFYAIAPENGSLRAHVPKRGLYARNSRNAILRDRAPEFQHVRSCCDMAFYTPMFRNGILRDHVPKMAFCATDPENGFLRDRVRKGHFTRHFRKKIIPRAHVPK